jgi:uncharacterized protein (DUF58 family)
VKALFTRAKARVRRAIYRSFRITWALQHDMSRRLSRAGALVLAGLGAAAVAGVDTNRTVAYQAFAFLLFALGIAALSGIGFRPRIAARRELPRFATAGEAVSYALSLRNDSDRHETGLAVLDDLADPRPSLEEFLAAHEPGEERRNWVDRTIGYPRWAWLVRRRRGAAPIERPLPPLPPRTTVDIRAELVPDRRGYLRFAAVTLARADPFGLLRTLRTQPAPQSLLVLPRRYPLPDVQLPGSRRFQQGGVALASSVGDSDEFFSLRDYRPGDPLRRIHWRSWAKAGRPIVKEHQDEFFVRHALVLDTFSASDDDDAFEEAVSVAASFACAVRTQDSLLDLMFVGPESYCFTAGRGVGHADRMLEVLACVRTCRDRPFETLHRSVVERHGALSGCICVLLAWDDDRKALVDQLIALGIETLALVVTAGPGEEAPWPPHVHRLVVGQAAEGLARL